MAYALWIASKRKWIVIRHNQQIVYDFPFFFLFPWTLRLLHVIVVIKFFCVRCLCREVQPSWDSNHVMEDILQPLQILWSLFWMWRHKLAWGDLRCVSDWGVYKHYSKYDQDNYGSHINKKLCDSYKVGISIKNILRIYKQELIPAKRQNKLGW